MTDHQTFCIDALLAIVTKADLVRQDLEAKGYEVLGLDGTSFSGEPILCIKEPHPSLVESLGSRRLWRNANRHSAREFHIADYQGCWVGFYVDFPKLQHARIQ